MVDDRPSCVNCSRTLTPDEQKLSRIVCEPCENTVRDNLRALSGRFGLYESLVGQGVNALTPQSRRNDNTGGSSSNRAGASAPARLDVLNLTGTGGVVTALQRWVEVWCYQRPFEIPKWSHSATWFTVMNPRSNSLTVVPGRLDQAVKCLENSMPWACQHFNEFRVFAVSVRHLVDSCKRAIDPSETRTMFRVGRCPVIFDDDTRCNCILWVDPSKYSAWCHYCNTRWSRDQWADLSAWISESQTTRSQQ